MAKRSRQTFQKHQKEQARQRKQQAKAARRLEAKQRRAASESHGAPLEVTDIERGLQPVPALGHHANQQAEPL